jgi:LmbE family N-acetylglucosaminyl deacetylase
MTVSVGSTLVLSPHTDRAELGTGETIARFLGEGKKLMVTANMRMQRVIWNDRI